jgi:hypothetical protein
MEGLLPEDGKLQLPTLAIQTPSILNAWLNMTITFVHLFPYTVILVDAYANLLKK